MMYDSIDNDFSSHQSMETTKSSIDPQIQWDNKHLRPLHESFTPTSAYTFLPYLIYAINYVGRLCKDAIEQFRVSLKSLDSCPRELYVNFGLKFCESYNYFAISQVLVIYLHEEFGLSDMAAGGAYGMWGAAITFWGLAASWLNDNLGVRRSLLLGFSISFLSTLSLAVTRSRTTLYIILFAIYPIGTSMGIPMLTVGIRRYTNTQNRGFAFGLYYAVMNLAAFVSGPVVDILNVSLHNGATIFGARYSGNRLVIVSSSLVCLLSVVLTYTSLREIRVSDSASADGAEHHAVSRSLTESINTSVNPMIEETSSHPMIPHNSINSQSSLEYEDESTDIESRLSTETLKGLEMTNLYRETSSDTLLDQSAKEIDGNNTSNVDHETIADENGQIMEFKPTDDSILTTAKILLESATFWRFTVFALCLVNLNSVFRHLDATLPTYLVREFGEHVPKGMLYSINPLLIIFLTPTVAAFTSRYAHYDMIKYGSYVTAISPFFLACSTSIWATVCFVSLLSVGEAIWSPRVYDYTMSISPEGREASFSALSSAPLFAAKIPVGLMSGYLLSTYLPESGGRDPRMLWFIVGMLTLSSPLLITLLEKYIREPEKQQAHSLSDSDNSVLEERGHSVNPLNNTRKVKLNERNNGQNQHINEILYDDSVLPTID